MDPTACLKRLLDAADDGDWEEAYYAAQDLFRWLRSGGFPPEVDGYTLQRALGFALPALENLARNDDPDYPDPSEDPGRDLHLSTRKPYR